MTSVLERIDANYDSSHWYLKGEDPMVDTWPLMGSPVPMLLILSVYFTIIALGPKIMKNRPAFNLDRTMLIYNAFQVSVAAWLAYKVIRKGIFKNGFLTAGCDYPVYTKDMLLVGAWEYFISKITELMDTVFFVLRKKNNQISFLHVFHHSSMVLYMWGSLKYAASGDGAVLVFLNCCVHVVMYTYYLLAGLGPRFQKHLWWKKYVTELQLIQFIMMLSYIVYTQLSPECSFSTVSRSIVFFNICVYMLLFLRFYFKSYKRVKSAKQTKDYKKGKEVESNLRPFLCH